MITKERIINEIDRLSDTELEKVYLFLASLKQDKKGELKIRSLKLGGKLDNQDLRSAAYDLPSTGHEHPGLWD